VAAPRGTGERAAPTPTASPSSPSSLDATSSVGPGYRFVHRSWLGEPVRWDPCDTITYALDLRRAPAYAGDDAGAAFGSVAEATALDLEHVDVPPASLAATFDRLAARESGGSDLGPDVVVMWVPHGRYLRLRETYDLGRSIATAYTFRTRGLDGRIVGALVLVDVRTTRPGGFGGWWSHGATMLHELGHAVGLAHVRDPGQIMYGGRHPDLGTDSWGEGDLEGLRLLGDPDAACD
jgi:hypothetical protein